MQCKNNIEFRLCQVGSDCDSKLAAKICVPEALIHMTWSLRSCGKRGGQVCTTQNRRSGGQHECSAAAPTARPKASGPSRLCSKAGYGLEADRTDTSVARGVLSSAFSADSMLDARLLGLLKVFWGLGSKKIGLGGLHVSNVLTSHYALSGNVNLN